ncbi:DUF996 domain-containing protein [Caminibacter mediatlanticus TB-2]|uniref:DUF996 domain-containing protein n=1 Tax=Caminibacter mediatlanticus TB-2 TaxID=391592 RepID=A0ABX5V8X5_9BACT|nr:DUF996 domain-containing protein [Caminibacter mediatlanticus]QCT94728.1 DUF996 domain-containing protein [Caminibacter mediatlanticus TB-2]
MSNKILGIVGSALIMLSILPTVSVFFLLIGFVLISIAIKDTNAFSDFIIGVVLNIIASFLFYFKLLAFIVSSLLAIFSQNPFIPLTFSMLIYLFIFYVLNIISAVYFKKSFDKLSVIYKNNFFKYAGYFIVIGAILVIFGIGMIISEIGWLLVLLGFFTIIVENNEIYDSEIIDTEVVEEKKRLIKNN